MLLEELDEVLLMELLLDDELLLNELEEVVAWSQTPKTQLKKCGSSSHP